jgi:mRNA-degrading endonuclease YafQ of YafQ-DinJ toxin-antitoxin module
MNRANFMLHHTSRYERDFKKIVRKDKLLASKVRDVSEKLSVNPFSIGLRTHIVRISSLGRVYSSKVSGDIRILWTLEEEGIIILLHWVGGHSGGSNVDK